MATPAAPPPGFQPWGDPDPQGIEGLNSSMVYGENIQFAVGINHQVAVGTNMQLCVNPIAMMDMLSLPGSTTLSGLLGTGIGGNMQFTLGTNTSITWGRQFAFTMGPDSIAVDANQHRPFGIVMCCLIGAACIAYPIAYGLSSDEDHRASIVIIYQVLIDLLLAAYVTQMMMYQTIDEKSSDALKIMFNSTGTDHSSVGNSFLQALMFIGIMAAAITPLVLVGIEEGHFAGEKQDSSA